METKKVTKKVPIFAGMEFTYPGTKNNKMRKVGYDIIEFIYRVYPDGDDSVLIDQRRVKRVLR